jgi:hypothetical protein
MKSQTAKKAALALGVASVASQFGTFAVKAGPALQTLNNLSNSAEATINNTLGQTFSVSGILSTTATNNFIRPFSTLTGSGVNALKNAGATLQTGFLGAIGVGLTATTTRVINGLRAVTSVTAFVTGLTGSGARVAALSVTASGGLAAVRIKIASQTGTQTIGGSASNTLFGTSSVKATTSFTNQIINDLTAF